MYHDGVRVHGLLVPDALINLVRGEDPARVLDQELHDFEFHGRQLHRLPVHAHLHCVLVQLQAAYGIDMVFVPVLLQGGQVLGIPAQMGIDPGQELQRREGLGHVVVRPHVQAHDLVYLFGLGGEHDDGELIFL